MPIKYQNSIKAKYEANLNFYRIIPSSHISKTSLQAKGVREHLADCRGMCVPDCLVEVIIFRYGNWLFLT